MQSMMGDTFMVQGKREEENRWYVNLRADCM